MGADSKGKMRLLIPFFLGLASASLKNIQYTVLENTKDCWKTCGNGYRYYGGPCEDPCGPGDMCCSHTPRGTCNFKQALTIKNEGLRGSFCVVGRDKTKKAPPTKIRQLQQRQQLQRRQPQQPLQQPPLQQLQPQLLQQLLPPQQQQQRQPQQRLQQQLQQQQQKLQQPKKACTTQSRWKAEKRIG